jgi:predicted nucleotidyltransferase
MNKRSYKTTLASLFATPERIRILRKAAFSSGRMSVNSIASELGLSKGLVSKYLELLARQGAAKRVKGKCMIDGVAPLSKGVKVLLNLHSLRGVPFKKHPFIVSAGLYGSCAKGENTEGSDVDLWVRVSAADDARLAAFSAVVRKQVPQVKLLFLTEEKLRNLKQKDPLFYHALAFGSIILYGEKHGLEF